MAKILVVDDSEDMRKLVRSYLSLEGYDVTTADDGAEGLEVAPDLQPDLIISDVMMPNMDGFGFFEAVRKEETTAGIPVIFLTAANDPKTLLRALRAGVDDFISKPFQREELLSVVERRLHERAHSQADEDPWTSQQKPVLPEGPPADEVDEGAETTEDEVDEGAENTEDEVSDADASDGESADTESAEETPAEEEKPEPARPAGPISIDGERPIKFSFSDTRLEAVDAALEKREEEATVLFCDVRKFDAFRKGIGGLELIEILTQFFLKARGTVEQQKGTLVKFMGDGFAAMFAPSDEVAEKAEVRALKSALMIVLAAQRLKSWLRVRFPDREFPEFAVGIGVSSGPITIGVLAPDRITIAGSAVDLAAKLERMTIELGWSIAAAQTVVGEASEVLALGRGAMTPATGGSENILIAEVRGPLADAAAGQEQLKVFSLIEAAVESNTAAIVSLVSGTEDEEEEDDNESTIPDNIDSR